MLLRRAVVTLVVLAVGCPAPSRNTPTTEPVVGERWRFDLGGLAEQTYEVTEVTPDEVRYVVRMSQGGVDLGGPLQEAFPRRPGPAPLEGGAPGPALVIGGRRLETWVTQDGARRVTTAIADRRPVFPGVVKVERGEEVLLELVDVQVPPPPPPDTR